MPSLRVIKTTVSDYLSLQQEPRTPEPDLVMETPQQVESYVRASREDGVMASVYLHHCSHICEVIHPGDLVLDLACGPATQLAMVARLNPESHFIGVDLSRTMLEQAQLHIDELGLRNVEFRHGDISRLHGWKDHSVDAVFSTMALHHLPDNHTLEQTFSEIARVLKPLGGICLFDFGRLRREKSMKAFANQYADLVPNIFTQDYFNSLKAAFSVPDWKNVWNKHLRQRSRFYRTFPTPFMLAVKSPAIARTDLEKEKIIDELALMYHAMPVWHKKDLRDLASVFRLSGLRSELLTRVTRKGEPSHKLTPSHPHK